MRLRWEQHLDLLPLPAGGLIVLGLGDVASHVPGALVDRSWDLPGRLLRAALLLEGAGVAVVLAGAIAKLTAVTDDPGRPQGLAGRTAVGVGRVVVGEAIPREIGRASCRERVGPFV